MNGSSYIACDLGAGSGRVIVGRLGDRKLTLDEVHRFVSPPVKIRGSLRWNVLEIFAELKAGLCKVAATGEKPAGVSVDSWGVDYVLFRQPEPMLSLPYQYRDPRTDAVFDPAVEKAGAELIFDETGIQFMPINTLYQLVAGMECSREIFAIADQFLNIADYFNYLFSGVPRAESSLASTTQIYNPRTGQWSRELIARFGFPDRIFPVIVPSGTRLGPLARDVCEETGLQALEVIATCSHDTGAAVAAVPASGDDWAFLSSGTWSLIGVELPAPLINEDVRRANFTNEAGYGNTTRFLKNIVGLWLLQECRRTWQQEGSSFDYEELMRLAETAEPFRSLVDPNFEPFSKPDNMPEKIAAFCRHSHQPPPETPGQFVRCMLESLALLYRVTLAELERLTGRTVRRLHIVGGGSQSRLLTQFAADATGRTVLAGPVEATAAGNVLIQAITLGHVASLAQGRKLVRESFSIDEFCPRPAAAWQQAADRFEAMTIRSRSF